MINPESESKDIELKKKARKRSHRRKVKVLVDKLNRKANRQFYKAQRAREQKQAEFDVKHSKLIRPSLEVIEEVNYSKGEEDFNGRG